MSSRDYFRVSGAIAVVGRIYTEHHIGWLDLMERLRHSGMSITQMREYTALCKAANRGATEASCPAR
jgi:DNA-binding transcriptional MerR regulator